MCSACAQFGRTCESGAEVPVPQVAEKKWWTGGELNSRHRDFQFSDREGSIEDHSALSTQIQRVPGGLPLTF
jgi:hypothetical protein